MHARIHDCLFFHFPLDGEMCSNVWFVIRIVSVSLLLQDKASFALIHIALERREQLLGDGRKSNDIDRRIIKISLCRSFLYFYKKYTKSSEKVKWIDSSVRMACPFLYHNILFSLILLLKKQQQ